MKKYFKTDISRQQKIVMIFVVLLISAFIGLIIFSWVTPKNTGLTSNLGGASLNGSQTTKEETAEDKSQTDSFNQQASADAIKKGETFITVPTGNPTPVNLNPTVQLAPPIFTPASSVTPNRVKSVEPNDSRYSEQTMKAAEALVKSLQQSNSYAAPVFAVTHDLPASTIEPSSILAAGTNTAASDGPSRNRSKVPSVIFPAFKLCPAQLNTLLDTDTNSIVTVKLSCGELFNAVIQAPGYKLVGENIDMTFTAMTFDGKPYKITAKPIDLDTGRSMLSGDVDHRYASRILMPALALSAAKFGSLFENSTQQSTYVSDGTIVQSSSGKVSSDQMKGAFVGGLGQQTANVLNADASRNPPIKVSRDDDNRTIGIMFLEPVLSSDAMDVTTAASSPEKHPDIENASQPAALNQMQQQQQLLQNTSNQLQVTPVPPGISYTPRQQAY